MDDDFWENTDMAASRGLSNVWDMIYSEILRPGKMYHHELVYAYLYKEYIIRG